jgi:hypothetical protein
MGTVGEAVVFYPSEIEHSVEHTEGGRIVLSVGALVLL